MVENPGSTQWKAGNGGVSAGSVESLEINISLAMLKKRIKMGKRRSFCVDKFSRLELGNAGRFGFMRVIQENFIFDRFRFIAFQESVCLFAR